ncbi:transglutaminase domain-containing protein [Formosa algae]|uniref:Transglutaminase-like putative cysteine protease n=1 Tax=Formosa algae TaxID=225843 RepID=A0A9X1CBT4_9FLAO|nr:transglutaminase family protein [Formosa algae]MBP1840362.1 transglutaminase-like putative cysteine protease [Formosa algae]MDQ0334226.1 transglutaminase-like putative cysteine protease [Formosa algae]OEI82218.1 transglutaminase [Formosa algae]PNW29557.1 transglutaminase [Formosa algae]
MFNYTIKYTTENTYENPVFESYWQFMVTPETNSSQDLISSSYSVSDDNSIEKSINGYNFETTRIHTKKPFNNLTFEAIFKLNKSEISPIEPNPEFTVEDDYKAIEVLDFKVDFEAFLNATELTALPKVAVKLFEFETSKHILDNVKQLNTWVYDLITFKAGETTEDMLLETVLEKKEGVSSDFVHLFCAIARVNKVPARYVSGYLHQGDGFFGDSEMYAWAEVYIPNLGWIGFDPGNNILADHNHIKVAHGRDYKDCPPLKQIMYAYGEQESKFAVEVNYEQ